MRAIAIIILLGLVSCQGDKSTMVKVEKYNHDKLMYTSYFESIKVTDDTRISIFFKDQRADTVYYFTVYSDNQSEIEFMGHKSRLIDRKKFEVDGEQIEVLKYRYDEKDGMDEELDFYLTTDGDILGFRELAWNGYEMFIDGRNYKVLAQLTSDTTTFFKYNYRFKYM